MSQTELAPGSAHKKQEIKAVPKTKTPPMVGVPAFLWWLAGPSSLMYWRIWKFFISLINFGPITNHKVIEVREAKIILNVIYLKTFRTLSSSMRLKDNL
jgi:hypothetical protein